MIQLTINGKRTSFDGDVEMPLLWFLRDELQLTGTKYGCGMGLCGACTVHVNGQAARSCLTPMKAAAGKYRTFLARTRAATDPIFAVLSADMDRQPYLYLKTTLHPRDY